MSFSGDRGQQRKCLGFWTWMGRVMLGVLAANSGCVGDEDIILGAGIDAVKWSESEGSEPDDADQPSNPEEANNESSPLPELAFASSSAWEELNCKAEDLGLYDAWVSDGVSIKRYAADTGKEKADLELDLESVGGLQSRFSSFSKMLLTEQGDLYLTEFGSGAVLRLHPETKEHYRLTHIFHDTYLLEEPMDVLLWKDYLVVLGNDSNNVVLLNRQLELVEEFGRQDLVSPTSMQLGMDGLLYVNVYPQPYQPFGVTVWDLHDRTRVGQFGNNTELGVLPSSLTFDCLGALYVANFFDEEIVRWNFEGRVTFADQLPWMTSLRFGPDLNLYVVTRDQGIFRLGGKTGSRKGTGQYISVELGELDQPTDILFVPSRG